MKTYFYLLVIVSLTASCGTATYMYDDVYDVAEGKSLTEEGYTDLIKDNEKNHKVVVDKEDKVTFGGYYPSTNQSGGTSFSNSTTNCNCDCGHNYNTNQWRYHQPGWIYNNPYSLWFSNCSCHHGYDPFAYHYVSFGNIYNLYGYYDYWGGWHPYYPLGMDPYGYYAYQYGWYPYQWYNTYNNGIFNGNNVVYTPSNNNTNTDGNHFYGHRNPSSTGSSNTTVYAHTVKDIIMDPAPVGATDNVHVISTPFNTSTGTKPAVANTVSAAGAVSFGDGIQSNLATHEDSFKPVSTNTNVVTNTTKPFIPSDQASSGTVTTTGNAGNSNHVVAGNQFEVKYPSGTAVKTVPGQGNTGGYTTDPSNSNSGNTTYYPVPVTTGSSNTTNESSTTTSRRTSSNTYNYNSNTNTNTNTNTNSGGTTTTSHRTTPSTTNSGSGSTTNSGGGSRTTTTSTSRR